MRIGKVLAVSVVGLASLILLAVVVIAVGIFMRSRGGAQQNFAPSEGQQAVSPDDSSIIFSKITGNSSFLYRKSGTDRKEKRLTSAKAGIESEPSFSHDGKYIVYSFADSQESKSTVWLVGSDGSNPHAITSRDQDCLHPVFGPDDSEVFYGVSNFTGNHSPIVRPARHDWDVFSIPIQAGAVIAGPNPTQITHTSFYDLQSLDVALDGITPTGTKLLVSTTGYPIGALIEEFNLGSIGGQKLFQPHVSGEPKMVGPSYGEARFLHKGMDIVFLAATNLSGGNYDYDVFSMSDVTGSDLKQLTHLKGMTQELRVLPDGRVTFVNGGAIYLLNVETQSVKPL